MDPTLIARIAHEADRALAAINLDLSVGGWNQLEAWERHSAVTGVRLTIATPDASAEILHDAWLRDKRDAGWTQGALAVAAKTDPMVKPWRELTPLQRRREELFLAVVRALA